MVDFELKHTGLLWLQRMVLACLLCVVGFTHAETATATDVDAETVAVGKILKDQQSPTQKETTAQPEIKIQQPNIANDMVDGESIRGLPTLNEPIVDQANLLSAAEKQQISQRILNLHNAGKGQVGVLIVPTTGQEDIFGYSMRVAEAWGLGSAKRDNGLLMTIAINDRRIQILTGYGLEGVIPDIVASRIINDKITPYFKQAQYAQGIDAGLAEIERILTLDPEIAAQAADELKERQEQAYQSHKATQSTLSSVLFIVVAGVIASFIFGKKLSASTAAVAGTAAGLVNGMGLVASLLIGAGVFFLLVTSIAQLIFQAFLSGGGRGGGSGRGGFGGGFGGGGGGFGGGGASGSW